MSYTFPLESYNGNPVELVSVIASYDTEGRMKPLYVRINDERYKIESCWIKPSICGDILDYNCTLVRDDRIYKVIMTYHIRETTWTIPKYLLDK